MRVVTWNVNSIRTRHPPVVAWLERHAPDVVLLQETKCNDLAFGALAADYRALGYETTHHGRDHYNGVAIISRVGIDQVERGFPGVSSADRPYDEPRLLSAVCGGIRMWSVYVPNGRKIHDPHWHFKLGWLRLLGVTVDADQPALVGGDFQV
jgi:exodeoxyribonuclease III